jgi:anti-sigma-K factor RskA
MSPAESEHRLAQRSLGAYALGALDDAERPRVAAHLEGCERCRQDLDDLQLVASALPEAAPEVEPPPELRDRIMSVVRVEAELLQAAGSEADVAAVREPRRRRGWAVLPRRIAVAGALAAVATGAVGGFLIGSATEDPTAPGRVVAATVDAGAAPDGRASLLLDGDDAQLRVERLPAAPEGRVYQVWLKRPDRAPEPTPALFDVSADGAGTVRVPGDLDGVQQVLVTAEPDGGSRSGLPSRQPIITAAVA